MRCPISGRLATVLGCLRGTSAPRASSDEIDLYIRTYYSLLRSSGEVFVRAFEEAHVFANSSLHAGARDPAPDIAAFAYSAARLPACMGQVRRVVLGQSHEQFEAAGLEVLDWQQVRARGRRRPLRWDGHDTLAVFISSTSDIDDLIPILTTYQIECNKLHQRLHESGLAQKLLAQTLLSPEQVGAALGLSAHEIALFQGALAEDWASGLHALCLDRGPGSAACGPLDLRVRLLNGSFSQYQRASQRWWSGIEPAYLRKQHPRRPPVYFVSSNSHSLSNLLGGFARLHRDRILGLATERDPEGLAAPLQEAMAAGDEATLDNLAYYLLRSLLHRHEQDGALHRDAVQRFDEESGIVSLESPGHIDVPAQLIDIRSLRPDRLDPRLQVPDPQVLGRSEAVIINIDYPLGMAAYHHLSRLAQGVGEIRGVYVMGKAATLNARVGDVLIPSVVHDEHSRNTYLFRNCFAAADVQRYMRAGSVLDNQKALTVRGTFLQNRDYMGVFYREGFTVLEMEAGPYLAAIYEIVNPVRYPGDQIVHLSNSVPFELGILHYASDTPYSRRQSLLSKSLSYFGVDSTYGCALAIVQRILQREAARLGA